MIRVLATVGYPQGPLAGDERMVDDLGDTAVAAHGHPLRVDAQTRLRHMVDDHFEFIWRALRGLGVSTTAADDAAQQVFWIASQKLDRIALGSERSFLFATARGIAANVRRAVARSREQLGHDTLADQVDESHDPEQAVASHQARRILSQVLEAMHEDLRTVFVLFELEEIPTHCIAEMLDLPMGTVASRLRRARQEFRDHASRLQRATGGRP